MLIGNAITSYHNPYSKREYEHPIWPKQARFFFKTPHQCDVPLTTGTTLHPGKTNGLEPTALHRFRKGTWSEPNLHDYVPAINLQGCSGRFWHIKSPIFFFRPLNPRTNLSDFDSDSWSLMKDSGKNNISRNHQIFLVVNKLNSSLEQSFVKSSWKSRWKKNMIKFTQVQVLQGLQGKFNHQHPLKLLETIAPWTIPPYLVIKKAQTKGMIISMIKHECYEWSYQ